VACARTFTLPDAAQLLGAVWRALDLRFPTRRAQSGRKFLRGDRPGTDETCAGVLRDMARAFGTPAATPDHASDSSHTAPCSADHRQLAPSSRLEARGSAAAR
jgi:hypothetical protein